MSFPITLAVGAALCLGLVILAAFLIILALRRGSQAIRKGVQSLEEASPSNEPISADTRWARGDLKAAPEPPKVGVVMEPCPACGGENPRGASTCGFCGRKLNL